MVRMNYALVTSQTVRPPWNDRFRSSCNTCHPIQIPGVPCTRGAMGSGIHWLVTSG